MCFASSSYFQMQQDHILQGQNAQGQYETAPDDQKHAARVE